MSAQQSSLQSTASNIPSININSTTSNNNNINNNTSAVPDIDISHQDVANLSIPNNLLMGQNPLSKSPIESAGLHNDILAGLFGFYQDGQTNMDQAQGRGSYRDIQSRGKQISERKALSAFDARLSGYMAEPSFQFGMPKDDQLPHLLNSFNNNSSTIGGPNYFGGSIRNQPSFIGYRFSSANNNINGNPAMSAYQPYLFPGTGCFQDDSSYLIMTGSLRPTQPQPQSYRINLQQFDSNNNQVQQGNQTEQKSQELQMFEKTVLNQLEQPQRTQQPAGTTTAMPDNQSFEVDPRISPQIQGNILSGISNNIHQKDEIVKNNNNSQLTHMNNLMNVNQSNIDFMSLVSTSPSSQMPLLDSASRLNHPSTFFRQQQQQQQQQQNNNKQVFVSSGSALNDRQFQSFERHHDDQNALLNDLKTEPLEDKKSSQQDSPSRDANFTTKLENSQEDAEVPSNKEKQHTLSQFESINREFSFNNRRRKRANLTQNLKGEIPNILQSSQIDLDVMKGISRSSLLQQMTQTQQSQQVQNFSFAKQNLTAVSDMPYASCFRSGFQQSQRDMLFSTIVPQNISQTAMPQMQMYMDHSALQPNPQTNNIQKAVTIEEGMACNCSKTKCLKLYCVCFQQGVMCGTSCRCSDCQNQSIFQQERDYAVKDILMRNPDAFKKKIQEISKPNDAGNNYQNYNSTVNEIDIDGQIPSSNGLTMIHKKGCNCKRTLCKKKYCECFSAGAKCTTLCRCEGCQNGKYDNLELQGKHINIEGSNIVDYENYNKGNFVSIKTKNNQFGNIKLEVFRPTNQMHQSGNQRFNNSISHDRNRHAEDEEQQQQQLNRDDNQNDNNNNNNCISQNNQDSLENIDDNFTNRKKIKISNEDQDQNSNNNFPPFLLQSDQPPEEQDNFQSFSSKQVNASQSNYASARFQEQMQQCDADGQCNQSNKDIVLQEQQNTDNQQIQDAPIEQLLLINKQEYKQQDNEANNACILSSNRSLVPLVDSDEKKEMAFMEFLAS